MADIIKSDNNIVAVRVENEQGQTTEYGIGDGSSGINWRQIDIYADKWVEDRENNCWIAEVDIPELPVTTTCTIGIFGSSNKESNDRSLDLWQNVYFAQSLARENNFAYIKFYSRTALTEQLKLIVKW